MVLFMVTCIKGGKEDEGTRLTRERVGYLKWFFLTRTIYGLARLRSYWLSIFALLVTNIVSNGSKSHIH